MEESEERRKELEESRKEVGKVAKRCRMKKGQKCNKREGSSERRMGVPKWKKGMKCGRKQVQKGRWKSRTKELWKEDRAEQRNWLLHALM